MNIALIIAGGSGNRMGQDIPKQFINIYDKPVLIYTLEGFQCHPMIDAIEVVCIDGWHEVLWAYAHQFNITKLKWVVSGGNSGQESIRNGVFHLENKAADDDIIIIHDGIRPLVDATVLTDVIQKAKQYTVSLYQYEVDQLSKQGALIPLAGGITFALADGFYSEDTGLILNPEQLGILEV